MKRILVLTAILVIAAAGLYVGQRRQHHDAVSPNAVLDVAADLQRDVTRAPMRATRLSDAEETRIGDELAHEYLMRWSVIDPDAMTTDAYVARVGERVAAHAHRRLKYQFHLLRNADFINAFAIPGGHVFIGLGLIQQMKSEDELAFVLGHEIEHIDHYHAAELVQVQARLHHLNLGLAADLVQIPVSLWQAGYSKDEEFEADREGLRLAAAAGYSPQGAILIFQKFEKLEREYVTHSATPAGELSRVAVEGLEGYFRSHPETTERMAQAERVIAQDPLPTGRPLTPLKKLVTFKQAAAN